MSSQAAAMREKATSLWEQQASFLDQQRKTRREVGKSLRASHWENEITAIFFRKLMLNYNMLDPSVMEQ